MSQMGFFSQQGDGREYFGNVSVLKEFKGASLEGGFLFRTTLPCGALRQVKWKGFGVTGKCRGEVVDEADRWRDVKYEVLLIHRNACH